MTRLLGAVFIVLMLVSPAAFAEHPNYADQGEAFAACIVDFNAARAAQPTYLVSADCSSAAISGTNRVYSCELRTPGGTYRACKVVLNGGTASRQYVYPATATCSTRGTGSSGMYLMGTSPNMCSAGCAYSGGTTGVGYSFNGKTYMHTTGTTPTGSTCGGGEEDTWGVPVSSEQCTTQGNLTQCVRPDGKHCAVASSGKKFCWNPTEQGTKVSSNEGATKSPEGAPINAPPIPPPNNGNWSQTANGTITVTNGGTSTTSNVTNFTSTNGTTGDGGGATNPDGSEDGGDEGDDGPGSPGGNLGDLYEGNGEKTVASVFQNFRTRVSASPIVDAVDSFFTVNVGGACPVFTVPASEYWDSMTLDWHCSGSIAQSLGYIGWVLLAGAAIAAAVWALS